MTVSELQRELIEEIKRITDGIYLVNVRGETISLQGFQQALPYDQVTPVEMAGEELEGKPELPLEELLFPYFVARVDNVIYPEDLEDCPKAKMILLFGIYDPDPDLRGYYSMDAILARTALRFRKNPVLGAYWCDKKMQLAFQDDDTFPHFFGGIEMTWNLPLLGMEDSI